MTEWYAYELVNGPIGSEWRDEVIAEMHEQLQLLNHLFSQANFTDKNHRKGPVPKPEHYPRPNESLREKVEVEDNDDLEDDDGWIIPRTFGSKDENEEDA